MPTYVYVMLHVANMVVLLSRKEINIMILRRHHWE